MAQHDYVIANGTGAAVRSDLNNALAAIVSQNSGAVAPTTTYAYMPWADTGSSPPVFKIRNAANNGWITLYELDGTFSVEAGSASSPGLYFTGDINTGIYSPGADQFGISTGGTSRLTIDASGNINMDSGTVYVDAANNRLGIGTTAPSGDGTVLHVHGTTYSTLHLTNGTSGQGASDGFEIVSLGDTAGDVLIRNRETGSLIVQNAGGEAFRVDSSRRLLVGTSSSANENATFQVQGSGSYAAQFFYSAANAAGSYLALSKSRGSAGSPSGISSGDVQGAIVFKGYAGTGWSDGAYIEAITDGTPGTGDIPTRLVFSTTADGASSPTERMRITNNGNVFINATTHPAVGTEMFGVAAQNSGQTIAAAFAGNVASAPTVFVTNGSNTTNTYLMRFASGSGGNTRGEIYYNGSQLVYATSSDYRLKENVQPFSGGIELVNRLRPVTYQWIENQNHDIGFIAHEVQEVFPNAVGGEKDAVDEDGKILPQTYDPSKLVPLLTAALQETIAELQALKVEVAALKGA